MRASQVARRSTAYAALFLLNGGKTFIGSEICGADTGISEQRANRGLIDVKCVPIMYAASAYIGKRKDGVQRGDFLLDGKIPVPSRGRH